MNLMITVIQEIRIIMTATATAKTMVMATAITIITDITIITAATTMATAWKVQGQKALQSIWQNLFVDVLWVGYYLWFGIIYDA